MRELKVESYSQTIGNTSTFNPKSKLLLVNMPCLFLIHYKHDSRKYYPFAILETPVLMGSKWKTSICLVCFEKRRSENKDGTQLFEHILHRGFIEDEDPNDPSKNVYKNGMRRVSVASQRFTEHLRSVHSTEEAYKFWEKKTEDDTPRITGMFKRVKLDEFKVPRLALHRFARLHGVSNRAIESKDFNDFAQLLIGMSSVHAGTRPFGKSTSYTHH